MATITIDPSATFKSGRDGDLVYYKLRRTLCVRLYVKPPNPDTVAQKEVRSRFSCAVKSWRQMPLSEKSKYIEKAGSIRMKGYNLYISEFMNGKIREEEHTMKTHQTADFTCPVKRLPAYTTIPSPFLLRSASIASLTRQLIVKTCVQFKKQSRILSSNANQPQAASAYG